LEKVQATLDMTTTVILIKLSFLKTSSANLNKFKVNFSPTNFHLSSIFLGDLSCEIKKNQEYAIEKYRKMRMKIINDFIL